MISHFIKFIGEDLHILFLTLNQAFFYIVITNKYNTKEPITDVVLSKIISCLI